MQLIYIVVISVSAGVDMNFTYVFVLVWLAYLVCSGVLLFSRGFLLARVSKTETSSCRRLSTNPNDVSNSEKARRNEIFI